MVNEALVSENVMQDGSRYAADFDYLMHDFVLDKVRPYFEGQTCLEMGGYKGVMSCKLLKYFPHVHTVEVVPEFCQVIREVSENRVTVHQDDFMTFSKYDAYDTILSCHSLEHVAQDVDLLKRIKTSKRRNAKLIVVVPNALSFSRRVAVEMGLLEKPEAVTSFEQQIGHHRTYTSESLERAAELAGLKVLESGGIMPKIFSNGQYDAALSAGIIDQDFLAGCAALSDTLPSLCASIYVVLK